MWDLCAADGHNSPTMHWEPAGRMRVWGWSVIWTDHTCTGRIRVFHTLCTSCTCVFTRRRKTTLLLYSELQSDSVSRLKQQQWRTQLTHMIHAIEVWSCSEISSGEEDEKCEVLILLRVNVVMWWRGICREEFLWVHRLHWDQTLSVSAACFYLFFTLIWTHRQCVWVWDWDCSQFQLQVTVFPRNWVSLSLMMTPVSVVHVSLSFYQLNFHKWSRTWISTDTHAVCVCVPVYTMCTNSFVHLEQRKHTRFPH